MATRPSTYVDFYAPYLPNLPYTLQKVDEDPPNENNDYSKGSDSEFYACYCPLHDNDNGSAGISKATGVFNCFVCGSFSMAQFLTRIDPTIDASEAYEMVDQFRRERKLTTHDDSFVTFIPGNTAKWDELHSRSLQLLNEQLPIVREYCLSRGVDYATLLQCKVGYLPSSDTHWGRPSLVFPYTYRGKVVGIRYRDIGANKSGEPGCHFGLWGIDDVPDDASCVVVVEGETDRLRVVQAIRNHVPEEGDDDDPIPYMHVVSTPTSAIRREWSREFTNVRQTILIPQDDEASQKMVVKARAYLPGVSIMSLPWRRRELGKDNADWLKYHTEEELCKLLQAIAEPATRRIMSGYEFDKASSKPMKWLIHGLLAKRQVALVAGKAKSKKTWFALNFIRSLLTKEPLCGIPGFQPMADDPIPNCLIIEEEGDIESFGLRVKGMVFKDVENWREHCFFGHHLGVKLDDDHWIDTLKREIRRNNISFLMIDPFQRTYMVDENSASEMGQVWNRIAQLTTEFPELAIMILLHFNGSGVIDQTWDAIRGSTRNAGEADLGFFMEARSEKEGGGSKMKIEGRNIPIPHAADGSDVFRLWFKEGLLRVDDAEIQAKPGGMLFDLITKNGPMPIEECAKLCNGVALPTVRNWVAKSKNPETGDPQLQLIMQNGGTYVRLWQESEF